MAHQLRHLVVIFSLCGFVFLSAGTTRAAELNFHFTVFSPQKLAGIAYVTARSPVRRVSPVVFSLTARSPAYEYRGSAPLEFIDVQSGEIVATAEVPADTHTPLLIFFPLGHAAENGIRYHVYVFEDSWTKVGAGGLGVLNFSGFAISGTIDRRKVDLSAGYSGPYDVGRSAKLQLRATIQDKSHQTYADTITLGMNGRAMLVLLPPYYKGSFEVQSRVLLDEVVVEKKDPAGKR